MRLSGFLLLPKFSRYAAFRVGVGSLERSGTVGIRVQAASDQGDAAIREFLDVEKCWLACWHGVGPGNKKASHERGWKRKSRLGGRLAECVGYGLLLLDAYWGRQVAR